ncbi:MAG: hypothetical protein Ct9H90mP20_1350 [Candidatus Neomarinimicrobiota bacterium]|nr:MAG: hypothetical protein Ct9H90mP20_1350 [Candidatus Neomarinimicrobiota bacterium]
MLNPGELAIHIHEIGDCASLDGSSAGGLWETPTGMTTASGEPHHFTVENRNLV